MSNDLDQDQDICYMFTFILLEVDFIEIQPLVALNLSEEDGILT